jgi:hypothetical protein
MLRKANCSKATGPMRITARASSRVAIEHTVAEEKTRIIGREENGNLLLGVTTERITLTPNTKYSLFISIDPMEIEAFYMASLTLPVPAKKPI